MERKLPVDVLNSIAAKLTKEEVVKNGNEILRMAANKVSEKLKQAIIADVTEGVKEHVINTSSHLNDKLVSAVQQWNQNCAEDAQLYPLGTRLVNRNESDTFIVIEHPPQVRTLQFNMLKSEENIVNYRLAMPYTVYVFMFKNGRFRALYCGWRKKPLSSLNDNIYSPNLPNINHDLSVCMGHSWKGAKADSISDQVSEVFIHWWGSTFNSDLNQFVREYQADSRLFSYNSWADNTKKDPLFILDVNLHNGCRINSLLNKSNPENQAFLNNLQNDIITLLNETRNKLKKGLDGVQIGTISQGEITNLFNNVLNDIIEKCYADLWLYCEGKLVREQAEMRKNMDDLLARKLTEIVKTAPW